MILISSCLIGESVRYDGKDKQVDRFKALVDAGKAVHICPEIIGGLNVPRPPAEIIGGDGFDVWNHHAKVMTHIGEDVTDAYKKGAQHTLDYCISHQIDTVVLKEGSPSCGSQWVYDGSFSGQKNAGVGVTTALLLNHGIQVFNEDEYLKTLSEKS